MASRLPTNERGVAVYSSRLDSLEERLRYAFRDQYLLAGATVHRSWCAEHPGSSPNERLEFLGDAVLGLIVTDHVYRTYPHLSEGELAKIRASVVNAVVLAQIAAEVDLGQALLLGRGEEETGGRPKASILADAMEAVFGAMYLDSGIEPVGELVLRLLGERIDGAASGPGRHDFKTRLQELAARMLADPPRYDVRGEGPDHAKRFSASVSLGGVVRGQGEGRSKKEAEQEAARQAWQDLAVALEAESSPG
jgi:ribonuclease-3